MALCLVTIVDSISATSMPVNEFVLFRNRNNYCFKEILISCSDIIPQNIKIPDALKVFFVGHQRSALRRVLQQLKHECDEQGDKIVFHLHAQKSAILFYLSSIGLGLRKKTLFTIHSTYSSRDIRYKMSSCFCSLLANYSNCVSEASYLEYNIIVKFLKGNKMVAIQNGVDFNRIQDAIATLPKHQKVADIHKLVCVGRMIPIKNQQFLVKLMKHLPESQLILIGKEDDKIKELVKTEGVEDRVIMTGLIPRDEVFKQLNECGIYVSASLVEGMPVSVLEAMSAGLIPVISDIAPHKEVAAAFKLFNTLPLIESDWVQTIKSYQQLDKSDFFRLSAELKDSVMQKFSLEAMHKQYNTIYKKLAE